MRVRRRRDLGLALLDDGAVLVRAQAAGIGAKVPPVAVGVLAFFSEPREPDSALRAFGPQAKALVDGLMQVGLLVPEEEAAETPVFFDNFASLDVHRRMLADRVRVEAYRAALEAVVQPGQRVLDAGTGTGVLAILAARAGAGAVVAVDNSTMVERAAKVVADSGLSEVVRCEKADFASLELEAPVDVVVTETFGALCLAEGAAEDLSRCLDRNLAEGGVVIPSAVSLKLAPVTDPAALAPVFEPWEVEGVDLSSLRAAQELRGVTRRVDPTHLGPEATLARVAFPREAVRVAGSVRVEGLEGPVHGLCAWFDLHLAPDHDLPTGPADPETHWQQVLLPGELPVVDGVLALDVEIEPAPEDRRGLVVRAAWAGGNRSWRIR